MSVQSRRLLTIKSLIAACGLVVGCQSNFDQVDRVLLDHDAARVGEDGTLGPFGVGCRQVRVQARVTDAFDAEVCAPLAPDNTVDRTHNHVPLIFLHGGLVGSERYQWLLTHLTSRGYIVAAPSHPADLALLQWGNAQVMLTWLRDQADGEGLLSGAVHRARAAVLGHSLGGVVGTWNWIADDRFTALALLASYPAAGDDVTTRADAPILSISGTKDLYSTPAEVEQGWDRFKAPRWLAMVDGMHHFAWADDNTAGELAKDGKPSRDIGDIRQDAMRVIDAFFDAHLLVDDAARKALESGTFAGAELTR